MRALRIEAPGAPLVEVELDDPVPGAGEVVVEVAAAGICHSDVHYRAGSPPPKTVPVIPGHEVAGVVTARGGEVDLGLGTRVALHYQIGCGACTSCHAGLERFCPNGEMLGNHRNGGYAEYVVVPELNAVPVPDAVSDEHAAALMCSSATSLHALRKGRLAPGERVAVFGCGGLGLSAIQLAHHLGAAQVLAIDPNPEKRALAETFGSEPVDPGDDVTAVLHELTGGRGVDVALDLVGSGAVMRSAIEVLAPLGRAVAVGLTMDRIEVGPYTELVTGERELIGCSDHTRAELVELLALVDLGDLDLSAVVTACVPLEARAVNAAFDMLQRFEGPIRSVIVPRRGEAFVTDGK